MPGRFVFAAVTPVALASGVALVAYLYLFDYRTDYAGHMIAGFGGTLAVLGTVVVLRRRAAPVVVVAATVGAIALGAAIEATVFRIAIFDPVDFANQSLGACLAAAGVLDRDGRAAGAVFIALGMVALAAGFHYAFA